MGPEPLGELLVELEVPARAEFVALARVVVATIASSRWGLEAERVDDLRLAVSEACTNAIEAHRAAAAESPVVVRVWENGDQLGVSIEDHGRGFDPDALPAHPPVTDPDRLNFERGLGIPLMRRLVDDVQFAPSPSGTSVRMTVWAGRRPARP
jgi:serine/threonine-protein kinase RsbW